MRPSGLSNAGAQHDDILMRARSGDARAFGELVRLHQDRVFRFVFRMLGSRDEAMDLTQETFVRAWQAIESWRPQAQFGTWLLQIARNASLDVLRRRGIVEFVAIDDEAVFADGSPLPEQQVAARQRIALLGQSLRSLPVEHREVLLLREIEALSYGEIATVLGLAEGTVKSRIARARAALSEIWARKTGEDRDD